MHYVRRFLAQIGGSAARPQRWYEVRYKDVRGWVNARYLVPMSTNLDGELH